MNTRPHHLLGRISVGFRTTVVAAVAVLAILSASIATTANAQPAATGSISGRVINAENGKYLSKARVAVEGTGLETFTNDYGEYLLRNVPAGTATLVANFTGQTTQSVNVTVAADQTTTQDLSFGRPSNVRADGTVVLDEFQVSADRLKNAREIAINEERFSVNIKNVVAADTFGDIPNGNVGEFVKFLPGVLVSYGSFGGNNQGYSDTDASGISVRGFGPEDTAILIDGMPVSNAIPGTLTRQVGLDMLAINNASRVELIKVATPDMPANSPGGQINLITKSAFEYARPSYSGKVFFNFNSLNPSLSKTVGPVNKKTYKTTPGLEFNAVYPMSAKFGVSFTGFWNQEFNQTYRAQPVLTYTGSVVNRAGQVVALGNPIFSRYQITDTPRMTDRVSGNIKLDWKPTPGQTLTANVQYSTYESVEAQRRLDARPTIGNGADWGPGYTVGTTANSTLDMTVTTRDKVGDTKSGQLQYKYQLGAWDIYAGASYSVSTGDFRDRENGHFSEIGLKLNPGQVILRDIVDSVPRKIVTSKRVSNGGGELDYTNLANYGFDGTIAKSGEASSRNTIGLYKLDVSRELDFLRFLGSNSLTFKFGGRRDQEKTEKWGIGTGYQEVLDTGKSYLVADILDTNYIGQSPGFDLPAQQWASTYKLYELNQTNKLFIAPADGATAVSNWNSYQGQQKSLTVTTDAWYGMLAGKFFRNRLSMVGGMRQEVKSNDGRGPFTDSKWNYAKNPNGTLYVDNFYKVGVRLDTGTSIRTNADGTTTNITNFLSDSALLTRLGSAGVKYPDHLYGPVGSSLESAKLNRVVNRDVHSRVKADPSYSLSAAYELTKKIQLKAAWSRALKLPPLEDATSGILTGSNQFSINENSPIPADGTRGSITVANPNLKPSLSNNWDFEASYYTDTGGKLSVSYWTKEVTNNIISFSSYSGTPVFDAVLPALGLNPDDYLDWRLTTSSNSNTAQKTDGWEFEVRQDFGFLGRFGRNFQAFASYSMKSLGDAPTVDPVTITRPDGSTITLTPVVKTITLSSNRFAGAGLQFSGRRFSAQIRGTYRNANEQSGQRVALANGNFLRRFEPAETRFDVNFDYRISKRYSAFLSGRDVFNATRKLEVRDDAGLLPSYAQTFEIKEFGVQWTVGVRGTF